MKKTTLVTTSLIFFPLMLSWLAILLTCRSTPHTLPQHDLENILDAKKWVYVHEVALDFNTHHVQGLEVTSDYYFVTSVDKQNRQGWLFKIARENPAKVTSKELTKDTLIHPGGLQFDDHFLWVPNAAYDRDGPSEILGLDVESLRVRRFFVVDDHIGAVASNGKDRLYGANWDTRQFYVWDLNGTQLQKINSPTTVKYQDMKFVEGKLFCNGHNEDTSAVDIIDPVRWELVRRISSPKMANVQNLSREGMAYDGRFYFLPDDSPNSRIFCYEFK